MDDITTDIDQLLPAVFKPSRYINNELNSFHKEPHRDKVNFCLAFPDLYEIGFSHLGLKLLYSIINNEADSTCDRVYAPDKDLIEQLKKHNIPLFSVENRLPLQEFDVLGFTLQSELTYTNVLCMLDIAGIPLLASERKEKQYPLIIAGGPCSVNPEPMADFIDLFLIGEAEEAIIEIKNIAKDFKLQEQPNCTLNNKPPDCYGERKKQLLEFLSEIEGVYVPLLAADGNDCRGEVKARKYSGFSKGISYDEQLISWQQTTHDRYIYEIMRGCSRGCRFCLAGYLYRPVRERDEERIITKLVEEVIKYGWEEAALLSLSSSDYSCIRPLIKKIIEQLRHFKTDISLPSLRVDSLDDDIIKLLNHTGQTGITIAPEAGSQRLRNIINKDITEEDILDLSRIAAANNWKIIKLYFMIGLPGETEEDVEEIVTLVQKILTITGKRQKINITLSPFIPKPHTPFQWAEMLNADELHRRVSIIKRELNRYKSVKIKYHTIESSVLECVLTRGDREIGKVIYTAYQDGSTFDGWDDYFNINIWEKAADKNGIRFSDYTAEIARDRPLTWDFVSLGITKEHLKKEYDKSKKGTLTKDCRISCTGCGVCLPEQLSHVNAVSFKEDFPTEKNEEFTSIPAGSYKYRLTYSKTGSLRFVTHLDMLRMMHRLLRKSGLPLKYTEGFNKHPRVNFCPPLSVGVEGCCEFMDIELNFPVTKGNILTALRKDSIKNFSWIDAKECDFDSLPDMKEYLYERVTVTVDRTDISSFSVKTDEYNNGKHRIGIRVRKGQSKEIDFEKIIRDIRFGDEQNPGMLVVDKMINGASIFDILYNIYDVNRNETGKMSIKRVGLSTEPELGNK